MTKSTALAAMIKLLRVLEMILFMVAMETTIFNLVLVMILFMVRVAMTPFTYQQAQI